MDLLVIDEWNMAALDETEASLSARLDTLADFEADLQSHSRLPGWDSDAAIAARGAFERTQAELNHEAAELGAARTVTDRTTEAVNHLKAQLGTLRALAAANAMVINADGSVADVPAAMCPTDPAVIAAREALKQELHDGAHALIMQALDVDADAAQVFSNISAGLVQSGGSTDVASSLDAGSRQGELSAPFPPQNASAQQIDAYWDALPESQRAEMIHEHPRLIGNLDGIPSVARSEANISQMPGDRANLEAQRAEIQQKLDAAVESVHSNNGRYYDGPARELQEQLDATDAKIASLDAIDRALVRNPGSLLTVYDVTDHERALAAIAVGNPDTADHITVTTPGVSTTVDGSIESMTSEANSLGREMNDQLVRAGRPDETVATIAYIGYEAPQMNDPIGIATDDIAVDAGGPLASYYEGLDAASETADPHITALGHSYGSLTTSEALQQGGSDVVDDVVLYGSPGLNAETPADMGMDADRVWVMAADGDWITGDGDPIEGVGNLGPVAPFGSGPYNDNFQDLSTVAGTSPDGVVRDGSAGHSEYTGLGENGVLRTAGYNVAVIAIGRPDLAMQ